MTYKPIPYVFAKQQKETCIECETNIGVKYQSYYGFHMCDPCLSEQICIDCGDINEPSWVDCKDGILCITCKNEKICQKCNGYDGDYVKSHPIGEFSYDDKEDTMNLCKLCKSCINSIVPKYQCQYCADNHYLTCEDCQDVTCDGCDKLCPKNKLKFVCTGGCNYNQDCGCWNGICESCFLKND